MYCENCSFRRRSSLRFARMRLRRLRILVLLSVCMDMFCDLLIKLKCLKLKRWVDCWSEIYS